ncbi:MAG: prephenate dehydrogenase [Anaerolineae bacterium]
MPDNRSPSPRIALVGLGRTGVSLGLALRRAYPSATVAGHDRDSDAAKAAQKAGAITKVHWNLIDACDGADLVLLALPAGEVLATLKPLGRELANGVVSDTAPLKAPLVRWAEANLPAGLRYVGGHPLLRPAEAASADAFEGCAYCLTPTPNTDASAVGVVADMATAIGAKLMYMDAAEHDGAMTYLRQMPALAAAAALQLARVSEASTDLKALHDALPREATVLAGASGSLAGLELAEADLAPMKAWLDRYVALLSRLRAALEPGQSTALEEMARALDGARTFWENEAVERPDGGTGDARPRGEPWRRLFGLR